jgi:hypothetical protein
MRGQSAYSEVNMKDQYCRYCSKKVVPRPPEPWTLRPRHGIVIPIERNDIGPAEILAPFESAAWGAHIYTGPSREPYEVKTRPDGCPEWVESVDWASWLRRGLAVWDHSTRQIGTLLAGEAIELSTSD